VGLERLQRLECHEAAPLVGLRGSPVAQSKLQPPSSPAVPPEAGDDASVVSCK
jgi:hypothetical protein